MAEYPEINPNNVVEDGALYPPGNYIVRIDKSELTRAQSTDRVMSYTEMTVEQPPQFAGRKVFMRRPIGTEEDPNAAQAKTIEQSMALSWYKSLYSNTGNAMPNRLEVILANAIGMTCGARMAVRKTEQGEFQNLNWFKIGEREIGLDATPASRPAPSAPPPAPGAPPAAQNQYAAPTAAPPSATASPAPVAAAPPPFPGTAPPPQPAPNLITCTHCNPPQQFTPADFAVHFAKEHAQG